MYAYTHIGQATNAVADPSANSAGVSEDERGGIKPSSDNVLFTGVLSEAHMKLAMIAGVECLFRIASGALRRQWPLAPGGAHKGKRHVVRSHARGLSPWVWRERRGARRHIRLRLRRGGIYGRKRKPGRLRAAGLGERPDGDNTLFDTASTAGILSVVRLRISNDGVRVISHTSWRSISRGRLQEDGHHCLQCPRITVGKTLVDGRLSGAYLHPPRSHRRKSARQRG